MSWTGNYWGPDGAVARAERKFSQSEQGSKDKVSLASAYYSAAGRAIVDARREWGLKGLLRALWFGWRAVGLIDQAWQHPRAKHILGLDQYDVSCAVWLRFGWLRGRRKGRVRALLREIHLDQFQPAGGKAHTKAFLLIHAYDAGLRELKFGMRLGELESLAAEAEDAGELAQASRVWKHIARLYRRAYPEGDVLQHQAERKAVALAEQAGATDQLVKLGVREDDGGGT